MKLLRVIYHALKVRIFCLMGMKPWSYGYTEYKFQEIKKILRAESFHVEKLSSGYGFRLDERVIEYPWLFSRLPKNMAGNFLDAGSVLNYEYLLKQEALQTKNVFISTLAPESNCYCREGISYVYEDLRNSCFRDGYFDWIASLSTIEHIGLDNTMLYTDDASKNEKSATSYLTAVEEYKRMLKPGGTLFLSFPFGKHENRGWFQIFDAIMLDKVIKSFGPNQVKERHYKYELDGWKVSSREESKGATYFDIHTQKSYDRDFAAASRAIACLEMIK